MFLAGSVGSSSGGSVTRSLDLGLTWGVTYLGGNVIAPIGSGVNAGTIAFNGKIVIGGGGAITVPIAYSDYVEAGAGIVNSGSNSNGSFVQFADGTMLGMGQYTTSGATVSWTFPVAFISPPFTWAQGYTQAGISFYISVGAPSDTAGNGYAAFTIGGAANYPFWGYEIGRWR